MSYILQGSTIFSKSQVGVHQFQFLKHVFSFKSNAKIYYLLNYKYNFSYFFLHFAQAYDDLAGVVLAFILTRQLGVSTADLTVQLSVAVQRKGRKDQIRMRAIRSIEVASMRNVVDDRAEFISYKGDRRLKQRLYQEPLPPENDLKYKSGQDRTF